QRAEYEPVDAEDHAEQPVSRKARHEPTSQQDDRGRNLEGDWKHRRLKAEGRSPTQTSRRPENAFDIVSSSAYSMSLPTGIPVAILVTRTPSGLRSRARERGGGSPS